MANDALVARRSGDRLRGIDSVNATFRPGPAEFRMPSTIEAAEGMGAAAPAVKAATDAATIQVPAGADVVTVTVAGNRTIAAPATLPKDDGSKLEFRVKQDGTGNRTLAWNAVYRFPGGTAPVLTPGAGKTDRFFFEFNKADAKFDLVRSVQNLA